MKKFLSLILALALVLGCAAPVLADNYTDDDWQGSAKGSVEGNANFSIDKYYVFPQDTEEVPENDVTFTLSVPGAEGAVLIEGDADHPTVYNGILEQGDNKIQVLGVDYDTDPTLSFSEATDSADRVHGDDASDTADAVEDSKDFVKKPVTIDFSKITYTEPGIYRYWLFEESSNGLVVDDIELEEDSSNPQTANAGWRTIDVYVIDDETNDHKLSVSEVVYEGKLTDADKPKTKANDPAAYDPNTYDVGADTTITENDWVYVDAATGDTYTYHYNTTEKKWEETITREGGQVETTRYRDTHLNEAAADIDGYESNVYKEAKDMGATNAQLQGKAWTYTDDNGVVHTYVYNTGDGEWKHTATDNTQDPVEAPDDDAKTEDGEVKKASTPDEVADMTYVAAAGQEGAGETYYIDEIGRHVWVKTDTASGETTKWTYDATNRNWKVTVITDNNDEPNDAAKTSDDTKIEIDKVNYSYVLAQSKADHEAGYTPATPTSPDPNGAEPDDTTKTDHYVNEYEAFNLTVKKVVTGNQGSRDKYFKFTVELKNAGDAHEIVLDLTKALGEIPTGKAGTDNPNAATSYTYADIVTDGNAATWKTDDTGAATITIYLNDGDEIVLQGIKKGAKYTITEVDGEAEGYTTTAIVESGDKLNGDKTSTTEVEYKAKKMEDSSLQEGTVVQYTNTRSGVIPTGVLMSIAGGAVLVAAAGAGIFALNRKRRDDDED